jgi:hypothetical protein
MPRDLPEEPEIHKTAPGNGAPSTEEMGAAAMPTPTAPPTPASLSRPVIPRPAPPRGDRSGPRSARIPKPGPGPRRTPATNAEIQLVHAEAASALDRADEAVDLLLESGRAPGDILVLTTGDAHPWQHHESSFGEDRYWSQLEEGGDVFYADALMTRPARREVVVLALNGSGDARAAQALTAALGRATALLVVCGDTAHVRGLLGGTPHPTRA